MRIKRKDLELLMTYLEKEKPELVELGVDEEAFRAGITVGFEDSEKRRCVVKLFGADRNITPELTKTMQLYTRVAKVTK